ncbi:MAG: hypothetical protein ACRD1K_03850 [Acidimicrobiales bacterium]
MTIAFRRAVATGFVLALAGGMAIALSRADEAGSQLSIPLDEYPGFGKSPEGALRDDSIALWEAYRRERTVESCMARRGFTYFLDVAFPGTVVLAVGRHLSVEPVRTEGLSPKSRNDAVRSGLQSLVERDAYFLALYGETSDAVDAYERNGGLTEGDDFATKGCMREAGAAVGNVWEVRRSLDPALAVLNQQIGASIAATYSSCTSKAGDISARNPAVLEARLNEAAPGSKDAPSVVDALDQCRDVWDGAFAAAEADLAQQFSLKHSRALSELRSRYDDVMSTIRADEPFRHYLAAHLGRATEGSSPSRPPPEPRR